jgi:hypothetical protein
MNYGAIFSDDPVIQLEPWKGALQVRQRAARHEDQPAASFLQPLQRLTRARVDDAMVGDRSIVVGGECKKTQVVLPMDAKVRWNWMRECIADLPCVRV